MNQRKLQKKEKAFLHKIFSYQRITRPELLSAMPYPASTGYRIVDDLIKDDFLLVCENSDEEVGKGRPTGVLSLNPELAYVFSIHISRTCFTTALVDCSGQILMNIKHTISVDLMPEEFLEKVYDDFLFLNAKYDIPFSKILAIGLAAVGPLDYANGKMLGALNFNSRSPAWRNVPLVEMIEKQLNRPVIMNCNARACLMGLYIPKYYHLHSDIGYVTLSRGIGSGIVKQGQLVNSQNIILDGLAHMIIDIHGKKCACGEYGCLETIATTTAITEQCRRKLLLGHQSIMLPNIDHLTFSDVYRAVREGDALASSVVIDAALIFSKGLCNFMRIISLDSFIIGGFLVEKIPLFYETVKQAVVRANPHISIYKELEESNNILKGIARQVIFEKLLS